jgi:hypothetical protein
MTDNNEDTTTTTVTADATSAAATAPVVDADIDATATSDSAAVVDVKVPPSSVVVADDEKKETDDTATATATTTTAAAAAKQTLKDLIHITDGGTDAVEAEVTGNDVDDWDTITEKHPFHKAVEDLTGSLRGGFQTHVVPKVDELVSNTQYLLDTHVAPHFQGVQEHSSRAVQGLQENTAKAVKGVQEHSSKVVKGVQEHSDRMIKGVQEHSTRAVAGLQEHSTKAIQGVQGTTLKAWQATEQSTKEFHSQHVAPHLDKATTATREFHQVHVQPKLDKVVHESTRAFQATGSCLQRTTNKTKQVIVEHRPWYWNTAPNLFHHDPSILQPWYWVLLEGTCRSFGQVIFCNNPWSGILIWLAIGLASPIAALCSVLCVVVVRARKNRHQNVCVSFLLN